MNIPEAELTLLTSYCDAIIENFKSMDEVGRWRMLSRVKALAVTASDDSFDYKRARKIREDLGLTRKALGAKIKLHELTLYKYETGRLAVDPENEGAVKYLKWLEGNGF